MTEKQSLNLFSIFHWLAIYETPLYKTITSEAKVTFNPEVRVKIQVHLFYAAPHF